MSGDNFKGGSGRWLILCIELKVIAKCFLKTPLPQFMTEACIKIMSERFSLITQIEMQMFDVYTYDKLKKRS